MRGARAPGSVRAEASQRPASPSSPRPRPPAEVRQGLAVEGRQGEVGGPGGEQLEGGHAAAKRTLCAMRIAALQFDVRAGDPDANLAAVEAGLGEAAAAGCRLVVLPEMWPTSFTPDAGEEQLAASEDAVEAVRGWSAEHGLVVCGSAYGRGADRPTNRFHVLDCGEDRGGYDKLHLFSPTAEHLHFAAGAGPLPAVPTSVGVLAPVVCYDLRFPAPLRAAFHAGAELCVCCAQWPRPRDGHLRALAVGRAVEGFWPLVVANRTGRAEVGRRRLELDFPGGSLVVSHHGEVLAEGQGEAGLVLADVDLEAARELRRRVPIAEDERRDLG